MKSIQKLSWTVSKKEPIFKQNKQYSTIKNLCKEYFAHIYAKSQKKSSTYMPASYRI